MNGATREIQAAVLRQKGGPFVIEPARLAPPRADEVIVKIVACGICHADLLARDGLMPTAMPIVLGHEGAGVVVETGASVRDVQVGDHVVLSFAFCGECKHCLSGDQGYCDRTFVLNWAGADLCGHKAVSDADGRPLGDYFFGQSSFSTYAVANQRNAVVVPKEAPLELLGPLGCGVQTGAGAVLNSLKVRAGSSFVCFGAGAVGMSALLAAQLCGAATTIAVDIVEPRLALATELGVTHVLDGNLPDIAQKIAELTGGGADYALDTTGVPAVINQGIASLAVRGTMGLVAGPMGAQASFEIIPFFAGGRTIKGIIEGDSVARSFIPRLVTLFMQGRFPFDRLVRFYDLADINQAAHDSEHGIAVKPIIRIGTPG